AWLLKSNNRILTHGVPTPMLKVEPKQLNFSRARRPLSTHPPDSVIAPNLLGLSVRTVENQVLKGMRLLSDTVYGSDPLAAQSGSEPIPQEKVGHGEQ
ncbi:MAG TPA: hypothetical protein VF193_08145, partial [Steroidobacter sp.]